MPNCQGIKQAGAVSFYKFFPEAISKKSAVFPFSPTFPSKIHTFPARFGATYDCGQNRERNGKGEIYNASQKDANQNKVKLDDSKAGEYTYTKFVKRVQKQDGWQGTDPSATASDGIGGIKAGLTVTKDNIGWTVTYSEKDGTVSFKEVQTDPTGLNG